MPDPIKREGGLRWTHWGRQFAGVLLGAGVGLMLREMVPEWDPVSVVLWCAVAGGLLASLEQLERSGAALTRRENRWLNLSVGLGGPLLILLIVWWLVPR